MDIQNNQQLVSDDQELAKVLAGVSADDSAASSVDNAQPEPSADEAAAAVADAMNLAAPAPVADDAAVPAPDQPVGEPVVAAPTDQATPATIQTDPALDGIKQTALLELRPLIGKLNVSPEEKFDTYLLLIRSTDDKELIAPAHEAAAAIADEARKAQALLDIIKEIDYLSSRSS